MQKQILFNGERYIEEGIGAEWWKWCWLGRGWRYRGGGIGICIPPREPMKRGDCGAATLPTKSQRENFKAENVSTSPCFFFFIHIYIFWIKNNNCRFNAKKYSEEGQLPSNQPRFFLFYLLFQWLLIRIKEKYWSCVCPTLCNSWLKPSNFI